MHLIPLVKDQIFRKPYKNAGFEIYDYSEEIESKEYAASRFRINHFSIVFREAKTTPTKTGQFVTLWKRDNNGKIQPFCFSDDIDFFIIGVRNENSFGHFIFSKQILIEQNIVTTEIKKGKLAMRVYAPWHIANSKQAIKTKKWQSDFFVELSSLKNSLSKIEVLLTNK